MYLYNNFSDGNEKPRLREYRCGRGCGDRRGRGRGRGDRRGRGRGRGYSSRR